jgi:hypothetical protein
VSPSEYFAFVRFELVLQPLPPFAHSRLIATPDVAELAAKAGLSSLACGFRAASGYAFGYIVAPTHQRDQYHALAIQSRGSVLRLDGIVDVDMGGRFRALAFGRPVPYCDAAS